MKEYKGFHIIRNIYGYYEVYITDRFYKFDTLSGAKNKINEVTK